MTRKDFELIARSVRETRARSTGAEQAVLDRLVFALASELKSTNPRFDAYRFSCACKGVGVEG
jgi:hypothetical protein